MSKATEKKQGAQASKKDKGAQAHKSSDQSTNGMSDHPKWNKFK